VNALGFSGSFVGQIPATNSTFTLGDGAGDVVYASMGGATVTLGDGAEDVVTRIGYAAVSTITLGNGDNDLVNLDFQVSPHSPRRRRQYNQPRQRQQ
jgi:hypothetical protein